MHSPAKKGKTEKSCIVCLFFLFVYCANFAVLTSLKFEKEKTLCFPILAAFSSK